MNTASSLVFISFAGAIALSGCGPSKAECDPLLAAMQKTGEAVEAPIYEEEGAKKVAASGEAAISEVAAVAVHHKELAKVQEKYVDRGRRLVTKLREWKKPTSNVEDVTTMQIKSLAEDLKIAHGNAHDLCTKK